MNYPLEGDPAGTDPAEAETDNFPSAPPVVQAAPAPRFCTACGAQWQPVWLTCGVCTTQHIPLALTAGGEPRAARVQSAILLYFSLLAVSLVSVVAVQAEANPINVDLAATIAMTAVVLIWCAFSGRPLLASLLKPVSAGWMGLALLCAMATFGLAVIVTGSLDVWLNFEDLTYSEPFFEAGYGLWLVVLVICVQPAIIEELAFRGVVLTSLRPALSETEAVLVSAMLFMTLHLSPAAFPHTFALGVVAGYMRIRSGSLLPGMLLHFAHNSMVIAAELLFGV